MTVLPPAHVLLHDCNTALSLLVFLAQFRKISHS